MAASERFDDLRRRAGRKPQDRVERVVWRLCVRGIRAIPQPARTGFRSDLGGIVRWFAVPGIGLAFAAWSMAIWRASIQRLRSLPPAALSSIPCPRSARIAPGNPVKHGRVAKVAPPAAQPKKSERLALAADAPLARVPLPAKTSPHDGFDKMVARAELSHDKVLAAFIRAGMTVTTRPDRPKSLCPCPSKSAFTWRLRRPGLCPIGLGPSVLNRRPRKGLRTSHWRWPDKRRSNSPTPMRAGTIRSSLAKRRSDDPLHDATQEPMPTTAPTQRHATAEGQPDRRSRQAGQPAQAGNAAPSPKPAKQPAKPDPEGVGLCAARQAGRRLAGAFNNLFNAPKAGNGVAVYDISAGRSTCRTAACSRRIRASARWPTTRASCM